MADNNTTKQRDAATISVMAKRSGIEALRQFIPDKNYTVDLVEHAAVGSPELTEDEDYGSVIRRNMVEKSVAILTHLRNNGYDFEVKADREAGQIKAYLPDYKMSIRLLDQDKNAIYSNKVHRDGVDYYFTSSYSGKNTDNKSNIEVTPAMAVDLVRYALGESVGRIDNNGPESVVLGETVGTAAVNLRAEDRVPITYSANKTFTSLYMRGKPKTSIEGRNVSELASSVYMHMANEKNPSMVPLESGDEYSYAEKNERFIQRSREAAEINFSEMLKFDAVDKLARMSIDGEFTGKPEFSDDTLVADMQKAYFEERVRIYKGEYASETDRNDALLAHDDSVKREVSDLFGDIGLRHINPVNVAAYMNPNKGFITNENHMLMALKAVRQADATNAYVIEGEGFEENHFKERMVAYDASPVYNNAGLQIYPMSLNPNKDGFDNLSPFWQTMGHSVYDGLSEMGVRVSDIHVDKNGVIHYEGDKLNGKAANSRSYGAVTGDIGQVFEPVANEFNSDGSLNLSYGMIETRFNSDANYYIAPGYTAYVVPPIDGNDVRSYEERTRLRGYEQSMTEKIKQTLRHDVLVMSKTSTYRDNAAGLNSVYHHIYGEKLPLDFEAQMMQEGQDADMIKAITDTMRSRVRYDSHYKDDTSVLSKVNADKMSQQQIRGYNEFTDNVKAVMAHMNPDTSNGYFDPLNTGTGTNQGVVRYLAHDATVNADGSIAPSENGTLCALCEHPDNKYIMYNPPDRAIMSLMNMQNQSSTARGRDMVSTMMTGEYFLYKSDIYPQLILMKDSDTIAEAQTETVLVEANGDVESRSTDEANALYEKIPENALLWTLHDDNSGYLSRNGEVLARFDWVDRSVRENAYRELGLVPEKIGVGTAHMALGGYTQDDAFVVSKDFADANMIRGVDGNMRPLQIGDKICDHSGNKGVISFIADRNADMSYYEPTQLPKISNDMTEDEKKAVSRERFNIRKANATKELQKRVIDVFKDNPMLDVVGAPYTAPSRFNGGTAREMIASQEKAREVGLPTTLNIEGRTVEGGIGYANWIITDMPVDEKTHIYETDGDGGRKASGQLVWGLAEMGAKELIDEIYKHNDGPTVKVREMLLATGLDLSETGVIHRGYAPHIVGSVEENGVVRPVFEERNAVSVKDIYQKNLNRVDAKTGELTLSNNGFKAGFTETMGKDGGFMKLPFPVKLASGDITPEALDENGKGTGEYMLPVLAGKFRCGRETVDNKLSVHEYTTYYENIYMAAKDYLEAKTDDKREAAVSAAQRSYNEMASNIVDRHFTGKHNIFKDEVMRKQLHGTATAVISPDASLNLNEISMTATMAISLGIDVDDPNVGNTPIVIWRDPLLSGGGIRQVVPRIIENRPDAPGYDARNPLIGQIGIAMNPSSATSFEGDFDGDSMGLYVPHSKEAKACVRRCISFPSQLLNRESGEKGKHSMYFQDGLDVAAGVYYDELNGGDVKYRMAEACALANKADALVGDERRLANQAAFKQYNEAMHAAHDAAFGHDVISYADPESHIKSLMPMLQSGAKGSPSKIINGYAKYFGATFTIDEDENGNYVVNDFKDVGAPYATDEERGASFAATHAKAYLTGVAGKFSQHAEMLALNYHDDTITYSASAAATALTHPVTQSVMQLKHDDAESIRNKIDMTQNVAPALWAGHVIKKDEATGEWEVVKEKDSNGRYQPITATPEQWKKSFMEFYTDKKGLNVAAPNPEHIETMARIMTVEENGKRFIRGFDSKTKALMNGEKPLTRLAYEASFDTLCRYADATANGRTANLFDGSVSSTMAPNAIRHNIEEKAKADAAALRNEVYVPDYIALRAKDTQFKNGVTAPSVDVIDKALELLDDTDVHMTTLKDAVGTKTPYAEMEIHDKISMLQSVARKAMAESFGEDRPVFTKTETEVMNMINQQAELRQQLVTQEAINEHAAKNPNCFYEYDTYRGFQQRLQAMNESSLDALSADEFKDVAMSVTEKYMARKNKGEALNLTSVETEFDNRLQEQNIRLKNMDKAARVEYINSHKEEFRERAACAECKKAIEAQRKLADEPTVTHAGISATANMPVPNVRHDNDRELH